MDTNSIYSKKCDRCKRNFSTCRERINHGFLQHYQQTGEANDSNIDKPLKIYKRRPITYYSINFTEYSNVYNFFMLKKQ